MERMGNKGIKPRRHAVFPAVCLAAYLCSAVVYAGGSADANPAKTTQAAPSQKTIIVFDLSAEKDVDRGTANLLTELVIDRVSRLKRYKVIGQKDIAKLLSWEQNKQLSGCTETACLVQIAGAMGADIYLEGSVGAVGDRYIVTLKAIDAASVSVLERITKVIPKDDNKVVDAVPPMVEELFSSPTLAEKKADGGPGSGKNEPPNKAQPARGVRTHDGFFLRMALGPGYSYASLSSSTVSRSISGASLHLNLSIGYSVVENFEISFDMFGPMLPEPSLSFSDADRPAAKTASWLGFGAGFNYYFMPYNIFLGISLGVVQLSISDLTANGFSGSINSKSSAGFAMGPMIGKEWWVSDNWGLGLLLQYVFAVAKGDYEAWWLGHSVGLMFCATYN